MNPALVVFGAVFLAELGDKSQLMAMAFAVRYRLPAVLAGVAIASAVTQALSVGVGTALRASLPTEQITTVAGAVFVAFAVWTFLELRHDDEEEVAPEAAKRSGRSSVATVAGAFLLAELGDKTMIATVALAAQYGPLVTWLGATAAMTTASGLAAVLANWLGDRLPQRQLQTAAGVVFAGVGAWLLWEGLAG